MIYNILKKTDFTILQSAIYKSIINYNTILIYFCLWGVADVNGGTRLVETYTFVSNKR